MENYSAIKWYEKDGEFVVELLFEVSDTDEAQGSSEIATFKTKEQQLNQVLEYAKAG